MSAKQKKYKRSKEECHNTNLQHTVHDKQASINETRFYYTPWVYKASKMPDKNFLWDDL